VFRLSLLYFWLHCKHDGDESPSDQSDSLHRAVQNRDPLLPPGTLHLAVLCTDVTLSYTFRVKQSTEQSSQHDLRPQIFRLVPRPAIMFRAITPTPSMKKCLFYRRFSSERPANCSAFVSF